MTLDFKLSKSGTHKSIYLQCNNKVDKQNFSLRIPIRISEQDWDFIKQRPKDIYKKRFKTINKKLNLIKVHLCEYINKLEAKKKTSFRRIFYKEIKNVCFNNNYDFPNNSLLYFTISYINSKKSSIRNSTYKRYMVFFHLLERFEGYCSRRLYIDSMNVDFIKEFIVFGKNEEYSENTIYRTIHFVKTILNFVERKGVRTCVMELQIRREKQRKEIVTLTEAEIEAIKKTEVSNDLVPAKDWLLISCYTGQRFSDFMNFSNKQLNSSIGKVCLKFTQQKTGKEILLPLHPTVLEIILKNNNNFPKTLTIQNYNRDLKKIGKLCKINSVI